MPRRQVYRAWRGIEMKTVVCFGEALIDFQPVSGPDPAGTTTYQQHAGGAPANVAVAVASLGGRSGFVGMLGSDAFGDFLFESLGKAGVDMGHVQRTSAAPTALAFVTLDAQGERSFSFYRQPAADLLFRECKLAPAVFEDAAVFHACSNSLTEEGIAQATLACLRRARQAGVLVSFDVNLRPALWPREANPAPRIWSALALADVVKLSREELGFLAASVDGEAAVIEALWKHRAALLIVTDGSRPLRWFGPSAQGTLESFRVDAIDSTAAGDAFTGGLLYALASRGIGRESLPALLADAERFDEVLRFAAACGALAVTRRGAFAAMPSRSEVETLLHSQSPATAEVTAE